MRKHGNVERHCQCRLAALLCKARRKSLIRPSVLLHLPSRRRHFMNERALMPQAPIRARHGFRPNLWKLHRCAASSFFLERRRLYSSSQRFAFVPYTERPPVTSIYPLFDLFIIGDALACSLSEDPLSGSFCADIETVACAVQVCSK